MFQFGCESQNLSGGTVETLTSQKFKLDTSRMKLQIELQWKGFNLCNSTSRSPWDGNANSREETIRVLNNQKFHCRTHKRPSLDNILSQFSLVHHLHPITFRSIVVILSHSSTHVGLQIFPLPVKKIKDFHISHFVFFDLIILIMCFTTLLIMIVDKIKLRKVLSYLHLGQFKGEPNKPMKCVFAGTLTLLNLSAQNAVPGRWMKY